MARDGGTKQDMLAERAMEELEVQAAVAAAQTAAARLSFDGVLGEINAKVQSLGKAAEDVARARARGYVWAGDLEDKLGRAQSLSQSAVSTARAETQRAARELKGRADALLSHVNRVSGRPAHTVHQEAHALGSEAAGLSAAVDAAERRARESVGPFAGTVDELVAQLTRVHFTLDSFEKASFRLQPEENPVLAVKATWEDSPQGNREGLLLFTAHRIRFEHTEEVVLERSFLFFASRTETRRALLLDGLIGQLGASDDAERGLVFKDQLLVLQFRPGANLPAKATFELDGCTAKEVDTLIEQLRSGDTQRGRYQGPMPAGSNVGVPVRWPSKCENCGAELTPPVRGQNLIACDYCHGQHPVELGQG
jgi:hypothetical protein